MKTRSLTCSKRTICFCLFSLLGFVSSSQAQWTNFLPVVTVYATDPHASWPGDAGQFTVVRHGPTNATLNVYYDVKGTATNGIDYSSLGHWVQIPAGERTNTIDVVPIDKGQDDTRTVVLVLTPSPLMPPVNYVIGFPSNAVVFISPAATTNIPPFVRITTPFDDARFLAPANIPICAGAFDLDGYVSTVEFFVGRTSLGITTNNPVSAGAMNPFCLVWSNAPPGDYALRALATDNGGATALSEPVAISVVSGPPPPSTTNYPPVVRITSPPNGALFSAPATIPLYAFARDVDDSVATVEFFDGTTSLGFGSNVCAVSPTPVPMCPTNLFVLVWSNAPVGRHLVLAQATDVRGAGGISEPVLLTVVTPPPPPTNRPPIVSIVAADPIAIEGTNCWPWLGLTNTAPTWTDWRNAPVSCRWFTNCGPKNATFVVRRFGATNDDLTLAYEIGGTATNGVDYVPLSGSVTLPAGQRRASITVVPVDDGPPDATSTVVLRLQPSASMPPGYLLGYPRAAAALIVDGPWPGHGPRVLSDGSFLLNAPGPDGAWFHVEYSTDLLNWIPICTNQVVNGSIDFVDPEAATSSFRFYRAVPEIAPSVP